MNQTILPPAGPVGNAPTAAISADPGEGIKLYILIYLLILFSHWDWESGVGKASPHELVVTPGRRIPKNRLHVLGRGFG